MTVTDNLLIQMRSPALAIADMSPTLVSESRTRLPTVFPCANFFISPSPWP